jgi:hypothetical protein
LNNCCPLYHTGRSPSHSFSSRSLSHTLSCRASGDGGGGEGGTGQRQSGRRTREAHSRASRSTWWKYTSQRHNRDFRPQPTRPCHPQRRAAARIALAIARSPAAGCRPAIRQAVFASSHERGSLPSV